MSDWLILRTSSRSTLRLAKSLTDIGIEAWSPSKVRNGKIPLRRARLPLREPILASFVFAAAGSSDMLVGLEMFPRSLPTFSLFRLDGKVPAIADRELDALREIEAQEALRMRRKERRHLLAGQRVRISEGPGEGLEGAVGKVRGGFVELTGKDIRHRLKIASWLLAEEGLESQRIAA